MAMSGWHKMCKAVVNTDIGSNNDGNADTDAQSIHTWGTTATGDHIATTEMVNLNTHLSLNVVPWMIKHHSLQYPTLVCMAIGLGLPHDPRFSSAL